MDQLPSANRRTAKIAQLKNWVWYNAQHPTTKERKMNAKQGCDSPTFHLTLERDGYTVELEQEGRIVGRSKAKGRFVPVHAVEQSWGRYTVVKEFVPE